jgi:hypothetical protein
MANGSLTDAPNPAGIAALDLALKRTIDDAINNGIGRGAILHLLIDHAFESLANPGEFPTPEQARQNARAVLDEALRLHTIHDEIAKGN